MKKSSTKVLLNAEPFGFGPTAAIATFFPTLREHFEVVSYLGKGHTLDLQKNLSYDQVYDVTLSSDEEVVEIIKEYDLVLTALDFEFAAISKQCGVKTIIYDPLTWYWKTIPNVVRESDMYIAQNFYGVTERLERDKDMFPENTQVVSPIVSQKRLRSSQDHILLNLGGLQNPFWSDDVVVKYAERIITAVHSITGGDKIVIAGSQLIAKKLPDFDIKSYKRDEMYKILEAASYAYMTPGLGNIYDAAKFNIPTIWLPPANDSQGQQLQLLKQHGAIDGCLDWSDLGHPIDYFGVQETVLSKIKAAVLGLNKNDLLDSAIANAEKNMGSKTTSSTAKLLDTFGIGGAEKVGEIIAEYSDNL